MYPRAVDAVCVIGAGGAGLAAAQALKARDVPFVVYEAGSGIGGNWRYEIEAFADRFGLREHIRLSSP